MRVVLGKRDSIALFDVVEHGVMMVVVVLVTSVNVVLQHAAISIGIKEL